MEVDADEKVNSVRLTGDFFLHPEEALEEIERTLAGLGTKEEEKVIKEKIDALIRSKNIQMVGFSSEDIARLLKKILTEEKGKEEEW